MFITLAEALPLLLCSFKLYLYFALAVSSSSSASRHLVRCQVLEPRELRGGVQLAAHQETSAVRRGQGPAKIFILSLEKYLNLSHCICILLDIGRVVFSWPGKSWHPRRCGAAVTESEGWGGGSVSRWYQRSYLHTKCGAGFHHHLAQRWRGFRDWSITILTLIPDIMLGSRGAASVIRLALGRGVKSQGDSVSGTVESSASPRWSYSHHL